MNILKDILSYWRSDDLISIAWKDSYEMLNLSKEMFVQAVKLLREKNNLRLAKALKKRDIQINDYHQTVRKKIMTYYVLHPEAANINNGFILANIVNDIERLGDYAKNILDIAIDYPDFIVGEKLPKDLANIEKITVKSFEKTLEAIHAQDTEVAQTLLEDYKENQDLSEIIIRKIIQEEIEFDSQKQAVAVALYSRYLKRIRAHLKNITTILINPFDTIGYEE